MRCTGSKHCMTPMPRRMVMTSQGACILNTGLLVAHTSGNAPRCYLQRGLVHRGDRGLLFWNHWGWLGTYLRSPSHKHGSPLPAAGTARLVLHHAAGGPQACRPFPRPSSMSTKQLSAAAQASWSLLQPGRSTMLGVGGRAAGALRLQQTSAVPSSQSAQQSFHRQSAPEHGAWDFGTLCLLPVCHSMLRNAYHLQHRRVVTSDTHKYPA